MSKVVDTKKISLKDELGITRWYTCELIQEDLLNESKAWAEYERGIEVMPGYIIIDELTPFDAEKTWAALKNKS